MASGIGLSHPELVRRWQKLAELALDAGIGVQITAGTRPRAEQEDLYARWRAGMYDVPVVADPNRRPSWKAPPELGGWQPVGSLHMPQEDGYSHAIDLASTPGRFAELDALAYSCGLWRDEPTETWHRQWWSHLGIHPAPALETPLQPSQVAHTTGEDLMLMTPSPRGDNRTVDFTWVQGEAQGFGFTFLAKLHIRRPAGGLPPSEVQVWMGGVPAQDGAPYLLPEDGSSIEVVVTRSGFLSVQGDVGQPVCEVQTYAFLAG